MNSKEENSKTLKKFVWICSKNSASDDPNIIFAYSVQCAEGVQCTGLPEAEFLNVIGTKFLRVFLLFNGTTIYIDSISINVPSAMRSFFFNPLTVDRVKKYTICTNKQ